MRSLQNSGWAWAVCVGTIAGSAVLAFWFLPERGRGDRAFAKEFVWMKTPGSEAIVDTAEDLPELEMLRNWEKIQGGRP